MRRPASSLVGRRSAVASLALILGASSCTAILGIDKDYREGTPGAGGGGGAASGAGGPSMCTTHQQCNDMNPCTTDTCNQGTHACQNINLAANTGCGSGKFCDGNGACVECLSDGDCAQSQGCVNNTCVDACGNGMKDGQETDVDCGGGVCPKCALGKGCNNDNDCVNNNCSGGSNTCEV